MKKLWLLLTPWLLYYFGIVLNVLVISANQGVMPVVMPRASVAILGTQPGDLLDRVHSVYQASDHLFLLCDWIQVPWIGTCSLGDMFLWLGDFLMWPCAIAFLVLMLCGHTAKPRDNF